MQSGSRRAILAALGANFGIAVAKLIGFAVTGAASMLAETVHSMADTSNQALLLWGGAAARREPTERHPFGFGRERYFWAFVVALVIFSLGALFAIVEGVEKLRHPHALENAGWAVAILVVGVLLEGLSLRTAVGEARPLRGGRSWWAFIRRTKNPELPVVLLEDLGALCGLLLALLGVGLAWATGEPRFDALGSVAIGVLLAIIAAVLAVEMKSLLIGEAALVEQVAEIREALLGGEEVQRLIHLRTMHLGPDQLLVAAKLEFREELSLREVSSAIDQAKRSVRDRVPIARMIFIEPDVYNPG
jgi:cation diffusion facilitator family transporter